MKSSQKVRHNVFSETQCTLALLWTGWNRTYHLALSGLNVITAWGRHKCVPLTSTYIWSVYQGWWVGQMQLIYPSQPLRSLVRWQSWCKNAYQAYVKSSWQHIILEICNVVIARCEKLHFCEKKHHTSTMRTTYWKQFTCRPSHKLVRPTERTNDLDGPLELE